MEGQSNALAEKLPALQQLPKNQTKQNKTKVSLQVLVKKMNKFQEDPPVRALPSAF